MVASPHLLTQWCRLFVHSLAQAGLRDVVLSPGARSTPMVLAVQRCEALRVHVVRDERAAAFFALGQVRASGKACALLCTSGTAPGHYLPAVMEARASGLPLLVISADRPSELHGIAAPQTVDQTHLYGAHAVGFVDLGMPDAHPAALKGLQRRAVQALHQCTHPVTGAVQVNLRATKPLEPPTAKVPCILTQRVDELIQAGAVRVFEGSHGLTSSGIAALSEALNVASRPLVLVGPHPARPQPGLRQVIFGLGCRLAAPVIAEAASQLRFGAALKGVCRPNGYDRILGLPSAVTALAPDFILQIGPPPTSARLLRALATWNAPRWIVAESGWPDVDNRAAGLVLGNMQATLTGLGATASKPQHYCEQWAAAETVAWSSQELPWGEGLVAKTLVQHMPDPAGLMLGNSLSIRHIETHVRGSERAPAVVVQRGVNGIEGLVAGACGWIQQSGRGMALLVGDVSLLHDASSLEWAQGLPAPLVIVVVDNRGGRIFEALDIQNRAPEAMPYFVTPPNVDMQALAQAYGAEYHLVGDEVGLIRAIDAGFERPGATVVHARVPSSGAQSQMKVLMAELEFAWQERGVRNV